MSGKQALPNRSRTTSKSSSGRSSEGSPPPKPPPAAPATYSNEELDYLEQQNEKHVTQKHLIYALDHVVQVLNKARLPYGVMGGMSMIFLGYRGRTTSDVDVAVQVKAKDLLAAFATDKRVYIPRASAVSGSGVARMFVLTGPSYGQTEAIPPLAVEVDLLLNGNKGAPKSLVAPATSTHTVNTGCGQRRYDILALHYLFEAKLRSFSSRESDKDYKDLVWMCASHTQAVKEVALRLPGDLKENFAAEYADNELDPKRVQWMYTLLGASRPSSSASSSTGSSSKGGGGGGSTGSSASKHLQPPRPQGSQTQRHR